MKTTKNKIVVLIVFLLAHLSIYAQYSGGSSDGSSLDIVSITSCSTPSHFYAYFGGNADGAGVETILNTTCGFSNHFYAYFGGTGDGAGVEQLDQTACGIPPSFFAYFGGTDDGAGVETISTTTCAFPPQFYAYFGGLGDGFSMDKTAPICPTIPPVASFTASATSICVGQSVTFTDTSINIPSAWTWTFTGGTPNSSIVQNPVITYNTPGSYAVTLVAANFNGTDTIIQTGYITVTAYPAVITTTTASRCDAGVVTLGATASAGTLSWYANPTGGTAIGTGTSFTTPSISSSTTFYVETTNGSCTSTRTAVVATLNATPTITGTTPANRCGTGSVSLSATSSAGSTIWYAAATGGTALATTNNFGTPSITSTTTYYVEAANGTCTSSTRIAVIATVNTIPTITSTTPASRCDTGSVILEATASAGTLSWYTTPTGGTSVGTGTSFTTPSISATSTYYVEATNGSCTSARTAVIATASPTPNITSTTPASRCDSGTVTLSATSNAGALNWYDSAIGGSVIGTGTNFLTPSIATSTTYYVEAINGICSSARTPVIATVNATPSIVTSVGDTRCGAGSVTLTATTSAGTLNWYNVATGGIVLGTGTSFAPSISSSSTYYVEATNATCTSPRTAVTVTVNDVPTIIGTTPNSRCDAGTLTLGATANAGTIAWYNVAIGGTAVGTGTSFTTPSISSSTTFYVETTNGSCTSTRTTVIASINPVASPTGNSVQTFCSGETVGLLMISGSNVVWYSTPTGSVIVPNDTALVTGTTYYASQTVTTCESPTRLPVTVSIGTCLSNDEFQRSELKLYPNPVTDVLNISYTEMISKIEVHNVLGQMVQSHNVNANESRIDMSSLASGTYLVRVTIDAKVKTFKVIKK